MSPFEARLDFPSQLLWLGIYNASPHCEGKRFGSKPIKLLRCFIFGSLIIEQNKLLCIKKKNLYLHERFGNGIAEVIL